MKIDWNRAPQGATHWDPTQDLWLKNLSDKWWGFHDTVGWVVLTQGPKGSPIPRKSNYATSIGDRVLSRIHQYQETHGREPTHIYLGKQDMAEAAVSTGGYPQSILTEYMGVEVVPVNLPSHLNLACVPKVDGRRRPVKIDVDRLEAEIKSYGTDDGLIPVDRVLELIDEEYQMCVDEPIEEDE